MTKVSYSLPVKPGKYSFLVEAEGFLDIDEKTGYVEPFLHHIMVKYIGRDITRILRKHPNCISLWDVVMEKTMFNLRMNLYILTIKDMDDD